jgi:hypothetical protein
MPKDGKVSITRVRWRVEASGTKTIPDQDREKVERALEQIPRAKDLRKRCWTYLHGSANDCRAHWHIIS